VSDKNNHWLRVFEKTRLFADHGFFLYQLSEVKKIHRHQQNAPRGGDTG
jgi:hypothetical protein